MSTQTLTTRKLVRDNSVTPESIVQMTAIKIGFEDSAVLKGVDLHVRKGETLVVLGKSGAGKSVLIKCIVGLIEPDDGIVRVFGKEIWQLTYKQLNEVRLRIGFLFQNAALYDSMTVGENLHFPLRFHFKNLSEEEIAERIADALDSVGLKESIDKMPSKLSGGMTKRIALARTLILRPEIMLYDEPTTGLDGVTAKEISELIVMMQKKNNITSVIITHDLACARITADRIVILKDGIIQSEGTFDELAASSDEWVKSFFV
jgi:phospholipid/cholesterol/gamma-HCH transport system ATP-binding protein